MATSFTITLSGVPQPWTHWLPQWWDGEKWVPAGELPLSLHAHWHDVGVPGQLGFHLKEYDTGQLSNFLLGPSFAPQESGHYIYDMTSGVLEDRTWRLR